MAYSQTQGLGKLYALLMLKSFLIWTFTLIVCFLVVGFPVVILMVTIGSLAAVVLQSIIPMSAVLLVAGGILGSTLLGVVVGAAILTLKGIHPDQVSWLRWLQDDAGACNAPIYASCPLTCSLKQ